jgi:hypothetical protein
VNKLNTNFRDSVHDLIWLLDRGYPKKPSIDIVGNKYRMNHQERMILYRGVFDTEGASRRKKKLIDPFISPPERLFIDFYNVLLTIFSYLRGMPVFRALDGYLRDTSELFGKFKLETIIRRCIDLVVDYIKDLNAIEYIGIFLDRPRNGGRDIEKLKSYIEDKAEEIPQSVVVRVVTSVDSEIKLESTSDTAVATSDSEIIERAEKVIDIPGHIITKVFQGDILELKRFI